MNSEPAAVMNGIVEAELRDIKRWNKFAKRFGMPWMTEQQMVEKAMRMSTSDGVHEEYERLRESARRSSKTGSQTEEQLRCQKLEELFRRI